jgi:serine/threonine protein kinase
VIEELRASDPAELGRYRLIGRLGDGGMGQVYLARSPGGRKVAVKVIKAELTQDEDFRARFSREVEAAKRVGGIFTAPVVDADPDCERPWLATAYVEGNSLAETVRDQGPLDPESVLRLAAGLAEGLAAIHAAGVIHRDLKPSNVLLAADGPRIIDFGISRPMDAGELTVTGSILGSPGFMSPEQAEGLPIGPPTDIFSLGAVLTYAATGEGPFGSARDTVMLYRVIYTAPNLAKVPGQLRPLIERCLAMDPAERPTPATILAELPPLAQSGLRHPNVGSQPVTNVRVFSGPVKMDERGYPVHVNHPEPVQEPQLQPPRQQAPRQQAPQQQPPMPRPLPLPPLLVPAPVRARRKGRGKLAYLPAAAVLVAAAGVALVIHFSGQTSALPDRVPSPGVTTPSSSRTAGASAQSDPGAVVRAYYKAINNADFSRAWALGGKNLGQNFTAFATGLAQYSNIGIMSLTSTGNTVTARAREVGIDGETNVINLTFTVANGVITGLTQHAS